MPSRKTVKHHANPTKRRTRVRGGSVFGWIRDKAIPWLKNNKIISKGANALAGILPPQYAGIAKAVSTGASAIGLGRGRRRHGGSLRSMATSLFNKRHAIHDFVKSNRLVSRASLGLHKLTGNEHLKTVGETAATLGYGRRRRGGALAYSRGSGLGYGKKKR